MTDTTTTEAAQRMLGLLRSSGLPEPDAIEHGEHGVSFLWLDQKVAVVVDLDDGAVSHQ